MFGSEFRVEAYRLSRFEEEVARAFDHSILVSEKEAEALRSRVSDRPISVIPNGVDLEYFAPAGDDSCCVNHPVIAFTGAMDYFPNIDAVKYFCHEIFPLVRRVLPAAEFYIVGRRPIPQVKALSHQPGVVVTGDVPDIRPYLWGSTVSIVPLRIGGGTRLKIFEALAMGKAVVSTQVGAEGLPIVPGQHFLQADSPADFAQAVVTLLKDPDRRRALGLAGRRLVEERYSWTQVTRQFEGHCEEVVARHAR